MAKGLKIVEISRPKTWIAGFHFCLAVVPEDWTQEQAEERARVKTVEMIEAQKSQE